MFNEYMRKHAGLAITGIWVGAGLGCLAAPPHAPAIFICATIATAVVVIGATTTV